MQKTIQAENVKINGKTLSFQTKFEQAIEMLSNISTAFRDTPLLIVTDSWFGNNGLFKPMRETIGRHTHILSRLRTNTAFYMHCHLNIGSIHAAEQKSMATK